MSIHPRYAEAILAGRKAVEFRKQRLARDIRLVVVYATAPISRIVGTFEVDDILVSTPDRLWQDYGQVGGIDKADFDAYYAGHLQAVGIVVRDAKRLPEEVSLDNIPGDPVPPQSWSYLPDTVLDDIAAGTSVWLATQKLAAKRVSPGDNDQDQ
jgi:predicted transcriptional regulator